MRYGPGQQRRASPQKADAEHHERRNSSTEKRRLHDAEGAMGHHVGHERVHGEPQKRQPGHRHEAAHRVGGAGEGKRRVAHAGGHRRHDDSRHEQQAEHGNEHQKRQQRENPTDEGCRQHDESAQDKGLIDGDGHSAGPFGHQQGQRRPCQKPRAHGCRRQRRRGEQKPQNAHRAEQIGHRRNGGDPGAREHFARALQTAQEHHGRRGNGGEKQREQKHVGDRLELRGLGKSPHGRRIGGQRDHESDEGEVHRAQGKRGARLVARIAQRKTFHGLSASFLRSSAQTRCAHTAERSCDTAHRTGALPSKRRF